MKKINNAFTLIELLAVIVILALILVIAIPLINNTITKAKKDALSSDLKIILNELERKEVDKDFNSEDINETNIESILGIKNSNYESVIVTKKDGEDYLLIKGKDKWDGLMAYGTYNDIIIDN